jgi:uncharacterized protein (TIGR00297 family)
VTYEQVKPLTSGGFSEDARQIVHIAMGGFAFLLAVLPWWQAVILACAAVAFNTHLLPRLARHRLYRPTEFSRRLQTGIALYPIAVLALLLVFPSRPDIVAAAWGIMAAGDGMATIVGRHVGSRRIPWNREKSVAGTAALIVFGGAAGALLAWWCRPAVVPTPYLWFSLAVPFAAAVAAAAAETVPIRLDDNISVPASAALVLWCASLVSEDLLRSAADGAAGAVLQAVAANAVVAGAGYAARTVSLSGAIAGFTIGTTILLFTGWAGWTLLLAAFLLATVTSRLGLRRKMLLGIAEPRGGRRGAGNAIANTGVAAAAAAVAALSYAREPALVAFAAALTAGASDTVASEVGKAWGRRTWSVVGFKAVPPGTSGAMSLEGTVAGLVAAFAMAVAAASLGIIGSTAVGPVVIAATAGSLVESVLGATLEAPGILNNDSLNFINTGVAALSAVALTGGL